MKFYTIICIFADGSRSQYDGLSLNDVVAVVETFDNLLIDSCSIEPDS